MIGRTRALVAGGAVLVLAAGVAIGATLAGGGSKPTRPAAAPAAATSAADFTLHGSLTLHLGAFQWNHAADGSTPCIGFQGYSDITAGAPVVITDQAGTVVATGQLQQGSATVDTSTGHAIGCTLSFAVPGVPGGRSFYGVAVSHRGTQTYSAADARAGAVSLSLG